MILYTRAYQIDHVPYQSVIHYLFLFFFSAFLLRSKTDCNIGSLRAYLPVYDARACIYGKWVYTEAV